MRDETTSTGRATRRRAKRRRVRLASDEARQWTAALIATILVFVLVAVFVGLLFSGVIPLDVARTLFETHAWLTSLGITWFFIGVAYATLTGIVFGRYRGAELRRFARVYDPRHRRSRLTLYLIMGDEISLPLAAVIVGLVGVIWLVVQPSFAETLVLIIPAIAGLVGGWLMMIVSFATSFLREWAAHDAVVFPDRGETGDRATDRRYSDFIYLATQFATTFGGSDVAMAGPRVRRLATLNSIVAFFFSTVVIGMFLSIVLSGSGA